ncbi:hypothetical protein QVD17_03909 [Tagetes erecta]|uniref:Transmembrane protein n=1 Tax=Tagetes erecta TaxID=13708 RepID=A0AAD8PAB0_TARER|nr:hypothetical protein QVD17_03909 [Tagetes erecta]
MNFDMYNLKKKEKKKRETKGKCVFSRGKRVGISKQPSLTYKSFIFIFIFNNILFSLTLSPAADDLPVM